MAGLLSGCRTAPQHVPAAEYQDIRNDLIHGDLTTAAKKVEQVQAEFSSDPSWTLQFKLLRAEIDSYQGHSASVVQLLNCDAFPFTATTDLTIKRDILCAQQEALLQKPSLSDSQLDEAKKLSFATHSPLTGEMLRMEALLADEYKHEPEASIQLYQDSRQAARASGDVFLESSDLLNLGMVALEREHFDEALDFFAKSSTLARTIQARQVLQAALGNSGLAYLDLGDSLRALSNFKQAEKEATVEGVANDQVAWLWDEGISNYRLGHVEDAESCYRHALELARTNHTYDALAGLNTEFGFLLYGKGQYTAALAAGKDAVAAAGLSQNRDAAIKPLFLQALIATHLSDAHAAEAQLLDAHTKAANTPDVLSASEAALGIFYSRAGEPKKADAWYRKAIHTFEAQRDAINAEDLRLPFFANGEAFYRDYADFLINAHRTDEALSLLDQSRARILTDGLGQSTTPGQAAVSAPRPQKTAQSLNATILFYSVGPEKSYLWAIDSEQTKLFTLPKASDLEAAIQSYNKSLLKSSDPLRDADGNAAFLYRSLVAPAASMLPLNARVVVIPDGVLNQLNFETLIAPGIKSPHYWIEDVTLTNANSMRMLTHAATGNAEERADRLLLVGNPIAAGTGFEGLPHAASEMQSVEQQFPQDARTIVAQAAAVPSSYVANGPEQYAYIHFVAHGTASLLNPLDSAVILSPTPQHPEIFKLYARDIVHHPIHAQLVTISACNGSGLRAYAGEGLVGLSWAFLRAGAHNVIGALWQVDDAATPLLMDHLYAEIRTRHEAPDAALRKAKLALIHSTGVYRKPLYWAAFQLYTGS